MAKKKSLNPKVSTPQAFSSSPFKSLKGLPAFAGEKPQVDVNRPMTLDVKKTPAAASCEHVSFADEMEFLGVKPLSGSMIEKMEPAKSSMVEAPQPPRSSLAEREDATFLEAIGAMEKTFKDEWTEDALVTPATPRRLRQVARGQLKPEAELDLHGLTVAEATAKVCFFLQDAARWGFQTILIITGKGLHSSDGPVLRLAMEKILDQQRKHVLEWGIAPRRYGGDGALVVFLRRTSED
jgi:DNA-nicking Smr family endonuclease